MKYTSPTVNMLMRSVDMNKTLGFACFYSKVSVSEKDIETFKNNGITVTNGALGSYTKLEWENTSE